MKLKQLIQYSFVTELSQHLGSESEANLLNVALRNFCEHGNPIRFNNLAFALRELILIIIDRKAPVKCVKNAS